MDTNHISQIWVRNMYQKFEAVYQEVDEFMNKVCFSIINNSVMMKLITGSSQIQELDEFMNKFMNMYQKFEAVYRKLFTSIMEQNFSEMVALLTVKHQHLSYFNKTSCPVNSYKWKIYRKWSPEKDNQRQTDRRGRRRNAATEREVVAGGTGMLTGDD
ncbi:hypothetical protein LXL04_023698 [Taraxacum kok-saghyz]